MSKCKHIFLWDGFDTCKCEKCELLVPDDIAEDYWDILLENKELKIALWDSINSPKGIVTKSTDKFWKEINNG